MIVFDQLNKNDPHLRTITWGVLAGLSVLFAGLWWVQIVSHKRYSESQKTQSFRTVRIPAVRGKILDRHGAAIAENRPSYNVVLYLDELRTQFRAEYTRARQPRLVTNSLPFWKRWVGLNPVQREYTKLTREQRVALERACRYRVASNAVGQIAVALQQPIPFGFDKFMRHYTNQLALPLSVIENLDGKQLARLLEGREPPPGIDIETQPLRFYPSGSLAAHIVGYLRPDNSSMEGEVADFNFRLPDYRGRVGIEGSFDADLRGKAGVKSVLVNNLGYRQTETVWTPAEPGRNVMLTIDAGIQAATEAALQSVPGMKDPRGAAIVLDPNTGDILAMASAPAFDPNWYIPSLSHATARWMNDEKLKPELNRPIYATYHPGSIFKIVTGISALEHGLDPFEKIWNPRWIKVNGRRDSIHDTAAAGEYDFLTAFIHSSNTYFITNGIRHGDIAGLVRLARRLHLGEKTDIMPYQELKGNFPFDAVKGRGWVDADTALICIGQGKISVTPLQMAIMVAAVANGGKVFWPRLVERVEPVEEQSEIPRRSYPPRPPRDDLGVSPRSLRITREAMLADVESPGGTGSKAFVEGFRVCGKTGTATVTNPRGEVIDQTVWFASYAPFENPRYVVVLMVESGGSGGGTCAPAVGRIYKAIQKLEQQGRPLVGQPSRLPAGASRPSEFAGGTPATAGATPAPLRAPALARIP